MSAVEFAIIVPILTALLFAILGFGIVFAQQLALDNAARESARYGAVAGRTCSDILDAAEDAAGTIAMAGSAVDVSVGVGENEAAALGSPKCDGGTSTPPCAGSTAGQSVYVALSYESHFLVPVPGVDDTIDLQGVGVFRCEFS